jgi:arylsulfatase A
MGYGDIHPYGSANPTPNLDRMAREGMRFTDFYVGQAVCTASRAALMTGCYSNRVGLLGALGPNSKMGISDKEFIVPQMFKSRGYATGMFGKWHLGDAPPFRPTRHGFDEYFGLPYSNDMWPQHPSSKFPDLPLIDGGKTVALNPDQHMLTTWYAEHAVSFIDRHKDQPFFLYVAHNMPHVPIFVSEKSAGKGGRGLYSDVVYEIDWSVGQILDALKRNGLDDNTLVIFTSDNGPWLTYGNHAGSAGPLREGKTTTFDGGMREPCLMRWPARIPAGATCAELASSIDFLPTFAALAGVELPKDRIIDGKDIRAVIFGEGKSPRDVYYFYWGRELQAVRSGKWKLHLSHTYNHVETAGKDGKPGKYAKTTIPESLFDLETDVGEQHDVAASHGDEVKRLMALAEQAREDLGDSAQNRTGKNVREPGKVSE